MGLNNLLPFWSAEDSVQKGNARVFPVHRWGFREGYAGCPQLFFRPSPRVQLVHQRVETSSKPLPSYGDIKTPAEVFPCNHFLGLAGGDHLAFFQ